MHKQCQFPRRRCVAGGGTPPSNQDGLQFATRTKEPDKETSFSSVGNASNLTLYSVTTLRGTALVIESQDLARDSLCEFLRDEGYEVHEAPNDFVGTRLIGEVPFDVVLTELMLPDAHGVMRLERLREATPHSRLIVMAAETTAETLSAITRLGAHYVQKPILFDDIVAALAQRPTS